MNQPLLPKQQQHLANDDIALIQQSISVLQQQLINVKQDLQTLYLLRNSVESDTNKFISDLIHQRLVIPTPQQVIHVPKLEWLLSRPRLNSQMHTFSSAPASIHLATPIFPVPPPPLHTEDTNPPELPLSNLEDPSVVDVPAPNQSKLNEYGLIRPLHIEGESEQARKHKLRLMRDHYRRVKFGVVPSEIRNATGRIYHDQAIESIESLVNAARDLKPTPMPSPSISSSAKSTPSNSPTISRLADKSSARPLKSVPPNKQNPALPSTTRKYKRKRSVASISLPEQPIKPDPGVRHDVQCTRCLSLPIFGDRFTCRECFPPWGTDLCGKCYVHRSSFKSEYHNPNHRFRKVTVILDPDDI